MPKIDQVLAELRAAGITAVSTAGTGIPLTGILYNTGTVALALGSTTVTGAGGANFTAAHNTAALAGLLYLFTAANRLYQIKSVDASLETLQLYTPPYAAESAGAYTLFKMWSGKQMLLHVPSANTGSIWIGDYSVDKTAKNGISISKGSSLVLDVNPLINFWVDADNSGDSISWMFLN